MFGLPIWVEIIVGGYLGGVVINLVTFLTAAYQLSRYGGDPFVRDWTGRFSEIVFAVFWLPGWIVVLNRVGDDLFDYPFHLVGTALGYQRSIKWFFDSGYWIRVVRSTLSR